LFSVGSVALNDAEVFMDDRLAKYDLEPSVALLQIGRGSMSEVRHYLRSRSSCRILS
jgi:hypothetical protein